MFLVKENINSKRDIAISLALVFCLDAAAADKEQYRLSDVRVDANATSGSEFAVSKKDDFQGTTTISRKMIEATPSGNGDITSLLKANPSVKFSNTNRQSTTMGEIDPADISINGSKFYQNSFIVDGMNINNDIDPAATRGYTRNVTGSAIQNIGASSSQGMAIDSDFIEALDVHDSDISAKYGGFTGGVIDAKTRDPKKGFHGKFSMSHTRDSWTKYHISEGMVDNFENSAQSDKQPKFMKYTTRLNLEGFLTDDFGLMFGYTNIRSKIPLKAYSSNYAGANYKELKVNQRRNIDNYFLKGLWYATDRLTITPSLTYAPQENKAYHDQSKDSFQYYQSGGLALNLKADYEFDFMKIDQHVGYSKLKTSRDAEVKNHLTWKPSNLKPWGFGSSNNSSKEGGWGDIDQVQNTLSYNFDLESNDIDALNSTHKIITGFELKKQDARFEIKEDFVTGANSRPLGASNCSPGDILCSKDSSNGGNGQYLATKTEYRKGKISVDMLSWAYYIEDEIKISNLKLRPGVRFDGNDYMDKKTIAPRFSSSYDVFGNEYTIISFGKNRYYGRSIFAYKLRDGKESLQQAYTRDRNLYSNNWIPRGKSPSSYKFSKLDIPYDDETSFGIKQKIDNLELAFKYIDRKGRDQIIKTKEKHSSGHCGVGKKCDIYSNDGYSDTQTWNVALRTIEPFKIMNTNHIFEISYEHFKTKTNALHYDIAEETIKKDIYYNGKIIDYGDLPASDYNRPWAIKFTSVSKIPQYGITLSNFLSYQGSVNAIVKNGKVGGYDRYEDVRLGKSFSWDSRIGYEVKLPKNMSAFVNLDIYNILNRSNKAKTASATSADLIYESGRQFWLEAGLKW